MHEFLSNLTAALLALHTVLGCCWHHAHCCTEACATAVCAESGDSCQGDHDHHAGASPDSRGPGHHGPQVCQGVACVYIGSTKTSAHDSAFQLDAPLPASVLGGPSVYGVVAGEPLFAADALLPPLRLHLICQVLLI